MVSGGGRVSFPFRTWLLVGGPYSRDGPTVRSILAAHGRLFYDQCLHTRGERNPFLSPRKKNKLLTPTQKTWFPHSV